MAQHGGARLRSGAKKDPTSEASLAARDGFVVLPVAGFKGKPPAWPKPALFDESGAESAVSKRAKKLWVETWKFPQAVVWAGEPWRFEVIAEYCVLTATIESDPARSAALFAQLHRYRDQLGLTPAGLKENGWRIGGEEVKKPSSKRQSSSRDRVLKAVAE